MDTQQHPHGVPTEGKKSKFEHKIFLELVGYGAEPRYETLKIPYLQFYTPDYQIKSGVIIECKGWFTPEDRTKMLSVKHHNPHLDIRFIFQADNKIHSSSKMRYSDWCLKHGFKFAIGSVPPEWTQ